MYSGNFIIPMCQLCEERIFELIFGVNMRQWFKALNTSNWKMDCTYSVPEDEKEESHADYKFLRQAVSMGGYFDTEISSYLYFNILYTVLCHKELRLWFMRHRRKGPITQPIVLL